MARRVRRAPRRRPGGFIKLDINPEPAPMTHITTEEGLPTGQRVLVFWPHSDDGIYSGATLAFMNARELETKKRKNRVKIAMVSPGYKGVHGEGTPKEKSERRWAEAVAAGYMLGFDENKHMINFNAVKTYRERRIHKADQRRMDALVRREAPTLVMLPSTLDTEQEININTRRMVMRSLRRWLSREYAAGRRGHVVIMEYPTNHVPLLTPSARNYAIEFTHPGHVTMKHEANKAHMSQDDRHLWQRGKFVEAEQTLREADQLDHMRRLSRKTERNLRGLDIDPNTGRGEEYLLTRLGVEMKRGKPVMVHRMLKTPLSASDRRMLGIRIPAMNEPKKGR